MTNPKPTYEELEKINKELTSRLEQLDSNHFNETIKFNEAQQIAMISNISDVIGIVDEQGVVKYKSPNIEKQFGWGQEELIGTSGFINVHPNDLDKIQTEFGKLLGKDGASTTVEYRYRCKDESYKYIELTAVNLIRDQNIKGVLLNYKDITDRIEIEKEVIAAKESAEENERLYKDLVESSQNLIWKCDLEGRFTFLNTAWEDTHGYKIKEMLGRPFSDFQRPEVFEHDMVEFAKHMAGGSVKGYETSHMRKDGSEIPLIFNALPLFNSKNEIIGTQGTAFDISKIKNAQQELIEAKEKAEESEKLKSAFLANMSHEIRTPMNSILGFSKLLQRKNVTEEKKEKYLDLISSGGDRLLSIISDIVDISKIEAGQISVIIETHNINKILDSLHHQFSINSSNVDLVVHKALTDNESHIRTDDVRITQILSNLLENAQKFTTDGMIEFGYTIEKKMMQFFVKDTGMGIDPKDHILVFDRFRQVENEYSRSGSGTGLGLSIVKGLVKQLGGEIWIESKIGVGAKFIFTIPYCKSEKSSAKNIDIEDQIIINSKKTILLVEDDLANTMYLDELLGDYKCNVILAKDGQEAVEMVKNNNTIDLVLLDVKMPVMNGFEATKEIRKIYPNIPIIAQTAYVMAEDGEKAKIVGCTDYVSKPISEAKLSEIMLTHLKLGNKKK